MDAGLAGPCMGGAWRRCMVHVWCMVVLYYLVWESSGILPGSVKLDLGVGSCLVWLVFGVEVEVADVVSSEMENISIAQQATLFNSKLCWCLRLPKLPSVTVVKWNIILDEIHD